MKNKNVFYSNELALWANFSGDYNPIHFEKSIASSMGFSDLVVHGMLAMLTLKNNVAQWSRRDENYRLDINLRKPVLVGEELCYKEEIEHNKLKVWLRSNSEIKYFTTTNKLDSNFFDIKPDFLKGYNELKVEHPYDDYNKFKTIFPECGSLWVALDALLFKYFIDNNEGNALAKETKDYLLAQPDFKEVKSVMQTTHNIDVSKNIHNFSASDLINLKVYTKGIDVNRTNNSVYGSIETYALINNVVILIQRMGLVTTTVNKRGNLEINTEN